MRRILFISSLVLFFVGISSVFTNCSGGFDDGLGVEEQSSVCGLDCFESEAQLEIRVNSGATTGQSLPIPPALSTFDVGGDCNQDEFNSAKIKWRLYYDSANDGAIEMGNNFDTNLSTQAQDSAVPDAVCDKGRWRMRVVLPRPGLDIDSSSGVDYRPHRLEFEIYGVANDGSLLQATNLWNTKATILLTPSSD